jgi:hypothetical protein
VIGKQKQFRRHEKKSYEIVKKKEEDKAKDYLEFKYFWR